MDKSIQNEMKINIEKEIRELIATGLNNSYEMILEKSNLENLEWIYEYGVKVSSEEIRMAKFYFTYSSNKLKAMGEQIVKAFLHGFISQSRNRGERRRVRFFYQIGQEPLAKEVVKALKREGLLPIVTKPQTLKTDKKPYLHFNADNADFIKEQYKTAYEKYSKELKDTCGMIGIGQFGEIQCSGLNSAEENEITTADFKIVTEIERYKAELESRYIKSYEISFCKVVFPNMMVGENFHEIFEEIMEMNLQEATKFELIQQVIIDALDKCDYVQIKGKDENITDLRINFWPLKDKKLHTNFLNCGGDLNIPYGEVFTTPKLKGTNGILHVKDIYLRNNYYHNLKLHFKDGKLVNCSCEINGKEEENYVRRTLLYPEESLPISEFAIGTNTNAFRICKKYKLASVLPILIYEKMGPHIAIGDPCFKGGEDAAIYNMYDNKEMIARENEITMLRNSDKKVYFQKHIDITVPYDEIEELCGMTNEGKKISIIENGRFVLVGTEELNIGMIERRQ